MTEIDPDLPLTTQVALLNLTVAHLTITVDEQKKSHHELISSVDRLNATWNAATGMLRFIKWLAACMAALGTVAIATKAVLLTHHG